MSEIIIRELQRDDLHQGFLESLDSLRQTSSINTDKAENIFEKIDSNPNHIVAVAELEKRIVGSATLLIESKFIHDGGLVGHIEDVVVNEKFQGQNIGQKIMDFLISTSKSLGCYKTILDCTDDVQPFYEKLGFRQTGNEMRLDNA